MPHLGAFLLMERGTFMFQSDSNKNDKGEARHLIF
jgi:hypothetical protein